MDTSARKSSFAFQLPFPFAPDEVIIAIKMRQDIESERIEDESEPVDVPDDYAFADLERENDKIDITKFVTSRRTIDFDFDPPNHSCCEVFGTSLQLNGGTLAEMKQSPLVRLRWATEPKSVMWRDDDKWGKTTYRATLQFEFENPELVMLITGWQWHNGYYPHTFLVSCDGQVVREELDDA